MSVAITQVSDAVAGASFTWTYCFSTLPRLRMHPDDAAVFAPLQMVTFTCCSRKDVLRRLTPVDLWRAAAPKHLNVRTVKDAAEHFLPDRGVTVLQAEINAEAPGT